MGNLNCLKSILPFFILVSILASCKSSYLYTDIHPEMIAFKNKENIEFTETSKRDIVIRTAFIGNAIDYSIFQIEIVNESEDALSLSFEDVRLVHTDGFQRNAHHKYNFIKQLSSEKNRVKKQKKASTIGNIIFGGLNVVAIAVGGGGANAANALFSGAESLAYISDDRRAFNAIESNIEDEISYIEEWVLFESIIPAEGVLTKDVIFPASNLNNDFDVEINIDGQTYFVPYNCVLREGKR